MGHCKKKCYWNMDGTCVSDSLAEIFEDVTFMTNDCIGFLREDMEEHMIEMKYALLAFCPEGEKGDEIAKYIVNMSYASALQMYSDVFGKDLIK
ncbi:MAG: hypothetical protein E6590_16745 [Clostridiales bacterium]|uniref:Uncharacterized protein n=1 Tax=Zhenhengia yiwuensis TaxID=2763666 RepID=A0A926EML2_9FIRM|nr:hypothetical protein [Zhenhengia yiwuensis]MBC8581082.1 hypothetical protein [Zhenhengia yiwuensis]MBS5801216.1 hypothetical protein [Clostridiales bacterium]MDU6361581.1 hypothetical protein [Clostridiales bacterium]